MNDAARPGNPVAVVALVLVAVAVAVVVAGLIYGFVGGVVERQSTDWFGSAVLGALVVSGLAAGVALPLTLAGVVLAIVGLARRGLPKRLAGFALGFGLPLLLVGLITLPFALAFGAAFF
jgi:hypothetical protein